MERLDPVGEKVQRDRSRWRRGEGAEGQVEKGGEERWRGTGRIGRIGRIAHTINHLSFELFRPVPLHPPDLSLFTPPWPPCDDSAKAAIRSVPLHLLVV